MQQKTESGSSNWFIKTDGHLKGPYPSPEAASQVMIAEGLKGQVVPGTADGREVLLG